MLPHFLAGLAHRKWEWGETDCTLITSDWLSVRYGIDPLARYRGTYATALECARLVRRKGGLTRLLDTALCGAGMTRVASPEREDVGIVSVRGGVRGRLVTRNLGAIFLAPDRVAVMTGGGAMFLRGPSIIAAWGVR